MARAPLFDVCPATWALYLPHFSSMIRITLLTTIVAFLAVYAWRHWYRSLCGLILLMAVMEHPDMPQSVFGIQGLNLWNILFAVVVIAWALNRRSEGLVWDMPRKVNVLLLLYLAVIIVGFLRMLADREGLVEYALLRGAWPPSQMTLWSDYFINTIKWAVPGLLLFDGCRSRDRLILALACILGVYFLLAVQVIKWMPLTAAITGGDLDARSAKILVNEIGYHRVNLSMMLAGASWAILSTRPLAKRGRDHLLIVACSLVVFFAQALTAGRAGYITWAAIGVALCVLRWRKYLVLAPLAATVVLVFVPGAMERMARGFDATSRDTSPRLHQSESWSGNPWGSRGMDLYTITAGRNLAWPYVIDEILEAPLFGYGREAMQRTGISAHLMRRFGESFPHPHNAYLQLLLDNGLVGAIPILLFFWAILRRASSLFRSSQAPEMLALGGVGFSLVLALLVASIGSQTFYPREGAVGMWCAIGLMMRVWVDRERVLEAERSMSASKRAGTALWERT